MPLEVFDSRSDVRNIFITPEIRSRVMRLEPGQVSQGHTHDLGHEMFVVLDGQAEFTIDGASAMVGPGQLCVARAGQWHTLRCVGDTPLTLYLSVTPHIEPTHTHWDREGGTKLPYRYGDSTRSERLARSEPGDPPEVLAEGYVAASQALREAAVSNASQQAAAATRLRAALTRGDKASARATIDEMWASFRQMYQSLQEVERVWNELAPAVAAE